MGYGNDSVDVAKCLEGFEINPQRQAEVVALYGYKGCAFSYFEKWMQQADGKLSQEDWDAWYKAHCAECPCMYEICMADVVRDEMTGVMK